ncbi:hypothetical protein, partial [Mesorhizobium sp.]|uniref:hypothetical protein n=1 Tax=Mesorhizobium sp. TaxID=1871066 RepID=UPI0025C1D11F
NRIELRRKAQPRCVNAIGIVTGRKKLAAASAHILQRWMLAKTIDDSAPLPVIIRGEDAGRQVRGSVDARKGVRGKFKPEAIALAPPGLTAEMMFFTEKKHLPLSKQRYRRHGSAYLAHCALAAGR